MDVFMPWLFRLCFPVTDGLGVSTTKREKNAVIQQLSTAEDASVVFAETRQRLSQLWGYAENGTTAEHACECVPCRPGNGIRMQKYARLMVRCADCRDAFLGLRRPRCFLVIDRALRLRSPGRPTPPWEPSVWLCARRLPIGLLCFPFGPFVSAVSAVCVSLSYVSCLYFWTLGDCRDAAGLLSPFFSIIGLEDHLGDMVHGAVEPLLLIIEEKRAATEDLQFQRRQGFVR